MPKSDFAPWLQSNNSGDEALTGLRQFAEAHRAEWPSYGQKLVTA
jgi:hypothetical protein